MSIFHLGADSVVAAPPPAKEVDNPAKWFIGAHEESEWWSGGFATRDEAVAVGRERHGPDDFYLVEARRMVPNLDCMNLFDGDELIERMQDNEAWGEDGWEGAGDAEELARRLNAALKGWFNETCSLAGAQLDFVHGPERVAA